MGFVYADIELINGILPENLVRHAPFLIFITKKGIDN